MPTNTHRFLDYLHNQTHFMKLQASTPPKSRTEATKTCKFALFLQHQQEFRDFSQVLASKIADYAQFTCKECIELREGLIKSLKLLTSQSNKPHRHGARQLTLQIYADLSKVQCYYKSKIFNSKTVPRKRDKSQEKEQKYDDEKKGQERGDWQKQNEQPQEEKPEQQLEQVEEVQQVEEEGLLQKEEEIKQNDQLRK